MTTPRKYPGNGRVEIDELLRGRSYQHVTATISTVRWPKTVPWNVFDLPCQHPVHGVLTKVDTAPQCEINCWNVRFKVQFEPPPRASGRELRKTNMSLERMLQVPIAPSKDAGSVSAKRGRVPRLTSSNTRQAESRPERESPQPIRPHQIPLRPLASTSI